MYRGFKYVYLLLRETCIYLEHVSRLQVYRKFGVKHDFRAHTKRLIDLDAETLKYMVELMFLISLINNEMLIIQLGTQTLTSTIMVMLQAS